jgi:hypothetical protein
MMENYFLILEDTRSPDASGGLKSTIREVRTLQMMKPFS